MASKSSKKASLSFAPMKIVLEDTDTDDKPKKKVKSASTKKADSTIVLKDINVSSLDKQYVLPEIAKKQNRSMGKNADDSDDKHLATTLASLGITTAKKDPVETIYWGEQYKIQMFMNVGLRATELNKDCKLKCSWCHNYPPEGALIMAVPFRYVPSYIEQHVYAPECVNVIESINVRDGDEKRVDPKNAPKINYFKRDLVSTDKCNYAKDRIVENEYFECAFPVCSFSCMKSKGNELSSRDPSFRNVKMMINFLYKKIFDKFPDKITPAPPCYILKEYGGDFTLDEYRENFKFVTLEDTQQFFINNLLRAVDRIYISTEKV